MIPRVIVVLLVSVVSLSIVYGKPIKEKVAPPIWGGGGPWGLVSCKRVCKPICNIVCPDGTRKSCTERCRTKCQKICVPNKMPAPVRKEYFH